MIHAGDTSPDAERSRQGAGRARGDRHRDAYRAEKTSGQRVPEALERVYETGVRLLARRIDLMTAELRWIAHDLMGALLGVVLIAGGAAWLAFSAYAALERVISDWSAAAIVGGVLVVLGALLASRMRRHVPRVEPDA